MQAQGYNRYAENVEDQPQGSQPMHAEWVHDGYANDNEQSQEQKKEPEIQQLELEAEREGENVHDTAPIQ